MVFTKFSNPHETVLDAATVKVNRSDLAIFKRDDKEDDGLSNSEDEEESDTRRIAALTAIVEASLAVDIPEPGPKKRAAKKKKIIPEFRLLPGPPRPISLVDPQDKAIPLIRPSEDNEEEARIRGERVNHAGVVYTLAELCRDASVPWTTHDMHRAIETVHLDAPRRTDNPPDPPKLPTLAVLMPSESVIRSSAMSSSKGKKSGLQCPVSIMRRTPAEGPPPRSNTRRRRRASANKPKEVRPPPRFFRPEGRSRGYALGFAGSSSRNPIDERKVRRRRIKFPQ